MKGYLNVFDKGRISIYTVRRRMEIATDFFCELREVGLPVAFVILIMALIFHDGVNQLVMLSGLD